VSIYRLHAGCCRRLNRINPELMRKNLLSSIFVIITAVAFPQEDAIRQFLSDPALKNASVSICIRDADTRQEIAVYNKDLSLVPASVLKLITSGVALEMLGPEYVFTTVVGYTGIINMKNGQLSGDIVIRGGGDPTLGSKYFAGHNPAFADDWVRELKRTGIRKVKGKVIADDSRFDYQPVPAKWQWEDIGNYYGSGVYGLSVFDNTAELHFSTGPDSTKPRLISISPEGYSCHYENFLLSSGTSDEGYVFAAPYSNSGWIAGTIPVNKDDFILKAALADPPLFTSMLLARKLMAEGITTKEEPSSYRLAGNHSHGDFVAIYETSSPPLTEIISVLNHESVNLFAETLLKELGKMYGRSGSTASGIRIVENFLSRSGINTDGFFMEDGSGLSPKDAMTSTSLTDFLIFMKNDGRYFSDYFASLPEAGKEGTLKYYFRDPAFDSRMSAKSGSMERVRCYAGYLRTISGKNMAFSILVNNYSGPVQEVIHGIEDILKEIISNK
jgi:D-alanyl-D-alanine carboxypeptidase/D-alanyl-D-alanine-endopeptidase (penicillin-binding protein 4)